MNADRDRVLAASAHPLVLGAAALVLVNDFGLRGVAPGWLTGKLSDVGWLVVTPVLLAALMAAAGVGARRSRIAGMAVAAVAYVTLQLWAPLGEAFKSTHVADAADLLALPALLGAVIAWRAPLRPRGRAVAYLAIPALGGVLLADDWSVHPDASWPCGEGSEWDPADGLVLQIGGIRGPTFDTDSFLRGTRLFDGDGVDVPLVAARGESGRVVVCARAGLRADTDYTWEIGPWNEVTSNEVAFQNDGLPTVRFRTHGGAGIPAASAADCAGLEPIPEDTGGEAGACRIGHWGGPDTGGGEAGDAASTPP